MTVTNFTPEQHPVFNELDKIGLLLGLVRLEGERNAEYRMRLFDVLVNRAGSNYRGLINGITRELGLELFNPFTIKPREDPNNLGTLLATHPAVVFSETKCYVYTDYSDTEAGLLLTLDRYLQEDNAYTIRQLANAIETTGYFECLLTPGVSPELRSMTIFNQSTIVTVTAEDLDSGGGRIKLRHNKLIPNSVVVQSGSLTTRVSSIANLRSPGQYYIDLTEGIIYSTSAPSIGSTVRYQYRDDNYAVQASPVIIHNLQSNDFRSKMFEQETINGETTNGAAGPLGLDLINELLSVYPLGWGI